MFNRNDNSYAAKNPPNEIRPPIQFNFTPANVLGSGTFAVLYKATLIENGTPVAIKFSKEYDCSNVEEQTEFEIEKEMFEKIHQDKESKDHHILNYYGYFLSFIYLKHITVNNGLVLELMTDSLENLINNKKNIPVVDRLRLNTHIADGLSYLHRLKIVHGDLKTANVLVKTNERGELEAKLCDFNSSAHLDKNPDSLRGTPYYISPESLKSDYKCAFLPPADVYPFGLVSVQLCFLTNLYELNFRMENSETGIRKFFVEVVEDQKRPCFPLDTSDWGTSKEANQRCFEVQTFIQRCWADDPSIRPTAADCFERFNEFHEQMRMDNPENRNAITLTQNVNSNTNNNSLTMSIENNPLRVLFGGKFPAEWNENCPFDKRQVVDTSYLLALLSHVTTDLIVQLTYLEDAYQRILSANKNFIEHNQKTNSAEFYWDDDIRVLLINHPYFQSFELNQIFLLKKAYLSCLKEVANNDKSPSFIATPENQQQLQTLLATNKKDPKLLDFQLAKLSIFKTSTTKSRIEANQYLKIIASRSSIL